MHKNSRQQVYNDFLDYHTVYCDLSECKKRVRSLTIENRLIRTYRLGMTSESTFILSTLCTPTSESLDLYSSVETQWVSCTQQAFHYKPLFHTDTESRPTNEWLCYNLPRDGSSYRNLLNYSDSYLDAPSTGPASGSRVSFCQHFPFGYSINFHFWDNIK